MQDTTLLMLLSALGLNYFFLNWGFGGFEIKQFAEVYWGKQPQKDACYCRKEIVVFE